MWRFIISISIILMGCNTGSDDSGYNGEVVALGTYQSTLRMKWFEDDPAPRSFLDVAIYGAGGKSQGKMYLITPGDTSLLCEGNFDWKQQEDKLLFWNTNQRCKDPDFMEDGFNPWDASPDTVKRSIRNITSGSFETQGEGPDGALFWAKYILAE
jgi:hypothetical protein